MTFELITVSQCADLSGLRPQELVLGAVPSLIHQSLHDSYLLHRRRGWGFVCDLIVADIRGALDLGAKKLAADLLVVLRRLLFERRAEARRRETLASRPTMESAVSLIERLSAMRVEPGRPRPLRKDGNVLFLAPVRRRRTTVRASR